MDYLDEAEWSPPTEAEKKILAAKRERQDKISKAMGDYLLKGYKMLASECHACGNILLRDKQQRDYCVACNDLDSDADKDNPALHTQAALSQVRENDGPRGTVAVIAPDSGSSPSTLPASSLARTDGRTIADDTRGNSSVTLHTGTGSAELSSIRRSAAAALLAKISWASQELGHTTNVDLALKLNELIKSCCESLQSVQNLTM